MGAFLLKKLGHDISFAPVMMRGYPFTDMLNYNCREEHSLP